MHIRRATIQNVRGFENVDLELTRPQGSLAGWTVIAGRNGAGKSTLLRALALAAAGPSAARSLQESFAGWVRNGAQEARVSLEIEYDTHDDKFQEAGKLPKESFRAQLTWKQNGGEEPHFAADESGRGRLSARRGPWADNPSGWIVLGYGPFRRASGEAAPAQRLMSGPPRLAGLVSLFREDASLVESIAWLRDIHLRALEGDRGARDTKDFVLRLLDDGLMPEGVTVKDFTSQGLIVGQRGVQMTLRDLSDGYRTVATLALDVVRHLDRSAPGLRRRDDGPLHGKPSPIIENHAVVLIDEVDAHLHVSWQQRIGGWLTRHLPNVQFLVTTHSPFICQGASARGLIRLAAPGAVDQRAAHVTDDLYRKVVNGGADDAVVTELFGLESPYSPASQEKRQKLAALEARVARRGDLTHAQRSELASLQQELDFGPSAQVARSLHDLARRLGRS